MRYWSPGYEIIRTYVRFAFWLTHKRIVVTGRHLIPKGKPIIFAPNHQNALMDPLALACTNTKQSVWLARADIFKSGTVSLILKYLKLLPVYRIRDGKENLQNNELIFGQVIKLLENKQTVALFPEAAHSGKRRMLPHKKAIPRIALEAEKRNNFSLALQIVPVGIYFSHYWAFNRTLIVEYGKPIEIDKYKEEYAESEQKAMLALRDEIHDRLASLVLNIKSETRYQEFEHIRQLAGDAYSRVHFFSTDVELQLFYAGKELIGKLEKMEKDQPDTFNHLLQAYSDYSKKVQQADLSDGQVKIAEKASWKRFTIQLTKATFSLPFFVFGFAFNAIPFIIPRVIIRRIVKDTTFLSTFNFLTGLIVFPLFYLFSANLLFALTDSWIISAIVFIMMPLGGKIAYQLLAFYGIVFRELVFLTGYKSYRNKVNQLLKQRNELIKSTLEHVNF